MKILILLYFLLFLVFNKSYSQNNCPNIDTLQYIETPIKNLIEKDSCVVKYLLNEFLHSPITRNSRFDSSKIKKVNKVSDDSSLIYYYDRINRTKIKMKIRFQKFKESNHKLTKKYSSDSSYVYCKLIDNQKPWGAHYSCSGYNEIKSGYLQIGEEKIDLIPYISNLYDIWVYDKSYYFPPRLYSSHDGRRLELYINGGLAASAYFAKIIFINGEFHKRIILDTIDNGRLSAHSYERKNDY